MKQTKPDEGQRDVLAALSGARGPRGAVERVPWDWGLSPSRSPRCFPELADDPTSVALLAETKAVRGKRSRWLTRGSASAAGADPAPSPRASPENAFSPLGAANPALGEAGVMPLQSGFGRRKAQEGSFSFFFFGRGWHSQSDSVPSPRYRVFEIRRPVSGTPSP